MFWEVGLKKNLYTQLRAKFRHNFKKLLRHLDLEESLSFREDLSEAVVLWWQFALLPNR